MKVGGMAVKHEEDFFRTPLSARYGCEEMSANWSDNKKFSTWRKLWLELARAEKVTKHHLFNLFNLELNNI